MKKISLAQCFSLLNYENMKSLLPLAIFLTLFFTLSYPTPERGTYITGPGLKPQHFRLPCQYFHIHESPSDDISVTIQGLIDERRYLIHHRIFRSTKDSFIVHYQIPPQIDSLEIRVFSNVTGEDINGSPVTIKERIYSHKCICPEGDFNRWLLRTCGETLDPQIIKDFAFFPEDIPWNVSIILDKLKEHFSNPRSQSYCHYLLKDNEVYRECFGEHVGFNMFVDSILHYLMRIVELPDVEFFINLGDWPLTRKETSPSLPIISWCKSSEFSDILWPTYDLTQSSLECMGRQELHIFSSRDHSKNTVWENKINQGYWRGRDSNVERLKLIQLGLRHPKHLNVGITRYFFFKEEEKELGVKEHVPFFDFFKYKYLITVDGTVAAYRLPYLLSGNSVVLKQNSEYYEHYYSKLIPNIHYIPLQKNLSNIIDKIEWARNNDDIVRKISNEARDFVNHNLLPHKIFCYHAQVLSEWRRRLMNKDRIEIKSSMEHIPQPKDDYFHMQHCSCETTHLKEEL
ncbi:protein O-glucosyltransferase 2 [Lepeophtheirus salmonis]|uniref:protein O-glucosyltransferase 2 n=1 Tax=Lepeophtheirus salmonis TaxID=72036 RepID=UPI001AE68B29|nr:protein O-glucosyltransferase 2-like [Lepeophtheirus salmonis]